jgi:hypothetical protein
MNALFMLLIFAAIGFVVAGPAAVILTIILFNKIAGLNRRLDKLEGKPGHDLHPAPPTTPIMPATKPVTVPASQTPKQNAPVEAKMP